MQNLSMRAAYFAVLSVALFGCGQSSRLESARSADELAVLAKSSFFKGEVTPAADSTIQTASSGSSQLITDGGYIADPNAPKGNDGGYIPAPGTGGGSTGGTGNTSGSTEGSSASNSGTQPSAEGGGSTTAGSGSNGGTSSGTTAGGTDGGAITNPPQSGGTDGGVIAGPSNGTDGGTVGGSSSGGTTTPGGAENPGGGQVAGPVPPPVTTEPPIEPPTPIVGTVDPETGGTSSGGSNTTDGGMVSPPPGAGGSDGGVVQVPNTGTGSGGGSSSDPTSPSNPTDPTGSGATGGGSVAQNGGSGSGTNPGSQPGGTDGGSVTNPGAGGSDGGTVVENPPSGGIIASENPGGGGGVVPDPSNPTNPGNPTGPVAGGGSSGGTGGSGGSNTNPGGTDGGTVGGGSTGGSDGGSVVGGNDPKHDCKPCTDPTVCPSFQVTLNRVCSQKRSAIPFPEFVFFEEAKNPILTFESQVNSCRSDKDSRKLASMGWAMSEGAQSRLLGVLFNSKRQPTRIALAKKDLKSVDLLHAKYRTQLSLAMTQVKAWFPHTWRNIWVEASVCDDTNKDGLCYGENPERQLLAASSGFRLGQLPRNVNLMVWNGRSRNIWNNPEMCEQQISPLVLDLSGDGFQFSSPEKGVLFDLQDTGRPVLSGWMVSKDDALLVRDLDGNGRIDSGAELFGSATRLPSGARAANGFEALKALDSNGNGSFDPSDIEWYSVRLWIDRNRDGISDRGELYSLRQAAIESISLNYLEAQEIDPYGNETRQRATYRRTVNGKSTLRQVIDVWFNTLNVD